MITLLLLEPIIHVLVDALAHHTAIYYISVSPIFDRSDIRSYLRLVLFFYSQFTIQMMLDIV